MGEGGEVLLDQLGSLANGDVESLAQTVGRDAVVDTKVGRLRLAAHQRGHLFGSYLKDFSSCRRVDVIAREEGVYHRWVLAQMRHDAQLHLRVVRTEQDSTDRLLMGMIHRNASRKARSVVRISDKGTTQGTTEVATDGDVLQIRIARGEPARGCDRLIVRSVQLTIGVAHLGQRIYVGVKQLARLTVV